MTTESGGAVILAAGASARLGQPKQLLVWQGMSLILRTVNAATEAGCTPVTVVVGAVREEIETELRKTPAAIAFNPQWESGIGTSIRCGVRHMVDAADSIEALVLLVCDQPLIDASVITALLAQWTKNRPAMVASRYAGTVGVPALFDRSCFAGLMQLPDNAGAKTLLQARPDEVLEIPFEGGAFDLDTPADLARAGIG